MRWTCLYVCQQAYLKNDTPKLHEILCTFSVAVSWSSSRHKMPLGMEVGLIPGDFILDGDPAPLPKKGAEPPIFRPMLIVVKRLDGSRWPRRLCVRWGPSPLPKRGRSPCPIFGPFLLWPNGCMDRDATGTEVGLGQDDTVLDGVPAPPSKKVAEPHPNFRPIFIVAKRLDASRCHLVWR